MATQINLGGIAKAHDGKFLGDGMVSNLPAQKILKAQVEAKSVPIKENQDKVEFNNNKVEAYGELKILLKSFQEVTKTLRNSPNPLDSSDNVFTSRTTNNSTNESAPAESFIKLDLQSGSPIRDYKFNVNQLASSRVKTFGASNSAVPPFLQTIDTQVGFSSATAPITTAAGVSAPGKFNAGSFIIQIPGATPPISQGITIAENDSLTTIANKINNFSSTTNVVAQVLPVNNSSDYRLELSSTKTGIVNDFVIDDTSDNVFNNGSIDLIETPAKDAILYVNGIKYQRPTNVINDFLPDKSAQVTLLNTNTGDQNTKWITSSVRTDMNKIKTTILQFAISYNKLIQFIAKQQLRNEKPITIDDKGLIRTKGLELDEKAFLGNDQFFKDLVSNVKNLIVGMVSGIGNSQYNALGNIGFTMETAVANKSEGTIAAANSLAFDENIFQKALDTNLDQVQNLFQFNATYPADKLSPPFGRKMIYDVNQLTVSVNTTSLDGAFDPTETIAFSYLTGSPPTTKIEYANFAPSSTIVTTGNRAGTITGRDKSAFSGLSMYYRGSMTNVTDNISMSFSQGLADKLFITIDNYTKKDGFIENEVKSINKQNTKLAEEIEKQQMIINKFVETQRNTLARLESQAAKINSALSSFDANAKAQRKN